MIIAITKSRTDRTSPFRVSTATCLDEIGVNLGIIGEDSFVTTSREPVDSSPPPPIHVSVSRNLKDISNF